QAQPLQSVSTPNTTPPPVVRRKPLPSSATVSPPQIRLEPTTNPETRVSGQAVHQLSAQKSQADGDSDDLEEPALIYTAQPLRITKSDSSRPNTPSRAGYARLSTLNIQRSPSKELQPSPANTSLATLAIDDDMALKPAPLRTNSTSSFPSQPSPDLKKPPTSASKFTAFFTRKPSTSSVNGSTDPEARSPLLSPYAESASSVQDHAFPASSSQRSQHSIPFDPSIYGQMSATMERAAALEVELHDITKELAASIKREMDLEDMVERLQAEAAPSLHHNDDTTSDYFSDSGTSSVRPPTSDMDPKHEIERVKREADQDRAQLKVDFSQRLQQELSTRKAMESDLHHVLQTLHSHSGQESQSQDMSARIKELEKRLDEERHANANFEDLLTALRADLEQHRNQRDNLRDEVVPQLKATIEGLEAGLAEAQKSPYDVARMQHEIQSLRDENQALQSARLMNAPFEAVAEGRSDSDSGQPSSILGTLAGGLQRSTTISLGRSTSRATLNRTKSVSKPNAQDQGQIINTPEQLKQVEQQRDALHDTVKYLLRRQALQNKQHQKSLEFAELEVERAKAQSQLNGPRKSGYEKEVRVLRAEINLLRKRADDAMDQKWKCEKGLAGLKLDLDRSKQETQSLHRLLRARDSNTPEALSAKLEHALHQLQTQGLATETQGSLQTLDTEQSIATELEQSTERTEALAAQVRKQLKTNSSLRDRLKEAIEKGERDQLASAGQINELQRKLQTLQDTITSAQIQSETAVMKHEEEVRLLRASTHVQLLRAKAVNTNILSPTPRSPLSPMFANSRKSPRLDHTTSGPGMALHQTLKTEYLEHKVSELEKALSDADAEMGEVIGRMNAAQIGVAELEAERDEALRQTRQLEQKVRMLVGDKLTKIILKRSDDWEKWLWQLRNTINSAVWKYIDPDGTTEPPAEPQPPIPADFHVNPAPPALQTAIPYEEIAASRAWDEEIAENITADEVANNVDHDHELDKALDDEIELTDNYIATPPPENAYSAYKIINNEARFTDFQPTRTLRLINEDSVKLTTKLRHVDIHNHWLRQEAQARRVLFEYLETAQMPADRFTKALPRQKYGEFIKLIKMTNITLRLQQER
ncbi:hypothetical protein DV736_g6071, partial [Chaetothyriales sp. CBS 134916]